jgi:NarL family two-component system response regulator LiaR
MTAHGRITSIPGQHLLLEQLTDRELQVLQLVAAGRRNREIAESLRVTVKTVEFHLSNILSKLNAQSRTEAVVRAWQTGMLRLNAS